MTLFLTLAISITVALVVAIIDVVTTPRPVRRWQEHTLTDQHGSDTYLIEVDEAGQPLPGELQRIRVEQARERYQRTQPKE